MIISFLIRCIREVSWRLLFKAGWLWCFKSFFALRAFKNRNKHDILFPPFLFFSLTTACNLHCRGCWVTQEKGHNVSPVSLPLEKIERVIQIGQQNSVYFYTLLGGEPFLTTTMWELIEHHPEAYFQVITNGQFFDTNNVKRLKKLGNVSPLISIDGFETENDARRGLGTFIKAINGCQELCRQKLLYGVATVVTAQNFESVLTEVYIRQFIELGAVYLWYYIYRPVGMDSASELAVNREQLSELRKRLLRLRRKMPIILIDTYWDAQGKAVCPASKGMAFVVGAKGSIEPCPPITVARNFLDDNNGDFYKTINESNFLRHFQQFVRDRYDGERSQGCVLIDYPQELAEFLRQEQVVDLSGRNFLTELDTAIPKTSHFLPGEEIPENYWVYRLLKQNLFFGIGAYG
ncbi:MAG: radical SAM protein [Planctomycetaceae bacterium]|jgi:MoaA/NifB/PqqE/SkfB family radical SAM enzyme|nr:radical SAM protein [Planctomycetaceae bacterium]